MFTSKSKLKNVVLAGMLAASSVVLAATMAVAPAPAYAQQEEGRRAPPPTRSSDTLSERVYRAINEIQGMLNPEDQSKEPDLAGAKRALDALNERYDSLNDFEKSTLLNFYTNYYLAS